MATNKPDNAHTGDRIRWGDEESGHQRGRPLQRLNRADSNDSMAIRSIHSRTRVDPAVTLPIQYRTVYVIVLRFSSCTQASCLIPWPGRFILKSSKAKTALTLLVLQQPLQKASCVSLARKHISSNLSVYRPRRPRVAYYCCRRSRVAPYNLVAKWTFQRPSPETTGRVRPKCPLAPEVEPILRNTGIPLQRLRWHFARGKYPRLCVMETSRLSQPRYCQPGKPSIKVITRFHYLTPGI